MKSSLPHIVTECHRPISDSLNALNLRGKLILIDLLKPWKDP